MLTYSKLYASRDLGQGKKWVMGKAKNRAMDGAVIYSVKRPEDQASAAW